MNKFFSPSALATVALVLSAVATPARADTLPRPNVTVTGDTIHVGDLFTDTGDHAGEAVAAAPAPGMRTTYDSNWLAAVAEEHHLAWTPQSSYDQVTIERASRVIDSNKIAAQLMAALQRQATLGDADLQLDNPGLAFVVGANVGDTLAIDGLTLDQRSGRFTAYIAPAGDLTMPHQEVTGRVVFEVELPVLSHSAAPGDAIAAQDIEHIRMRRDQLGAGAIFDDAELIGKTPRRPLLAEQPIRTGDIQVPIVVHKDTLVTIVLQTPTMRLTAQGKAADDGAMGAAIRVANTQSDRVIDATVVGPDTVIVTPAGAPTQTASR